MHAGSREQKGRMAAHEAPYEIPGCPLTQAKLSPHENEVCAKLEAWCREEEEKASAPYEPEEPARYTLSDEGELIEHRANGAPADAVARPTTRMSPSGTPTGAANWLRLNCPMAQIAAACCLPTPTAARRSHRAPCSSPTCVRSRCRPDRSTA